MTTDMSDWYESERHHPTPSLLRKNVTPYPDTGQESRGLSEGESLRHYRERENPYPVVPFPSLPHWGRDLERGVFAIQLTETERIHPQPSLDPQEHIIYNNPTSPAMERPQPLQIVRKCQAIRYPPSPLSRRGRGPAPYSDSRVGLRVIPLIPSPIVGEG